MFPQPADWRWARRCPRPCCSRRGRTAPGSAVQLYLRLTERSKTLAKVVDNRLRLFPRGEVGAFRMLLVIEQLRVGLFRPLPRDWADLLGEGADDRRNLDALRG